MRHLVEEALLCLGHAFGIRFGEHKAGAKQRSQSKFPGFSLCGLVFCGTQNLSDARARPINDWCGALAQELFGAKQNRQAGAQQQPQCARQAARAGAQTLGLEREQLAKRPQSEKVTQRRRVRRPGARENQIERDPPPHNKTASARG